MFRVTHITGDKITLCRDGARRHEKPITWGQVHEARTVRFTVRPFCAPAYIHALPVGKDACRALQQGSLRHSAHGLRLSKGCGNAVIAHDCTIRDRSRHLEHVALEGARMKCSSRGQEKRSHVPAK